MSEFITVPADGSGGVTTPAPAAAPPLPTSPATPLAAGSLPGSTQKAWCNQICLKLPWARNLFSCSFQTISSNLGCEVVSSDFILSIFPTCQVRVVRFYLSSSRLLLLFLLLFLLLLLLLPVSPRPCLHQLLPGNSSPSSSPTSQLSVHRWTSAWDLPSSVCTAGPQLGPAQLSVHRWTSTWDPASSVCTAGPQPGTLPAQCAPLDLNLGPSQLSVHRWTSTWDPPSSVCTAGPQPGTLPAQCAPLDLNLGPSQLSVHRWTSTWDPPSSVCTAGPQPGTASSVCTA